MGRFPLIEICSRIGVVTGSVPEARCLPETARFITRCSGADPARARAVTGELIGLGVDALLSFGLAGGLDRALAPGAILLPDRVVDAAAPSEGGLAADPDWRAEVTGRLGSAGIAASGGPIVGSDEAVPTVAAKRALGASLGGRAVDMESHVVARAAAAAGLPFLVLRAVADPAGQALPRAALRALRTDGRTSAAGLLGGLARRPADLVPLIRLGLAARRGFRSLRLAARLL